MPKKGENPKQQEMFKLFEEYEGIERIEAVKKVARKMKIKEHTVQSYYTLWRKKNLVQNLLPYSVKPMDDNKFEGNNGIYDFEKDFILSKDGAKLEFQNRNEWEMFKREMDCMWDYAVAKAGL